MFRLLGRGSRLSRSKVEGRSLQFSLLWVTMADNYCIGRHLEVRKQPLPGYRGHPAHQVSRPYRDCLRRHWIPRTVYCQQAWYVKGTIRARVWVERLILFNSSARMHGGCSISGGDGEETSESDRRSWKSRLHCELCFGKLLDDRLSCLMRYYLGIRPSKHPVH